MKSRFQQLACAVFTTRSADVTETCADITMTAAQLSRWLWITFTPCAYSSNAQVYASAQLSHQFPNFE